MKKVYFLCLIFLLMMAVSCVRDAEMGLSEEFVYDDPDAQYAIPVEDAVAELESVLQELYPATRSGGGKIIESIETVGGDDVLPATRSGVSLPSSTYHLANFSGGGFAVMAGDTRLNGSVMVVANSGSISKGVFNTSKKFSDLTMEDLYCEEDDDYYVGVVGASQGMNVIGGMLTSYAYSQIQTSTSTVDGKPADDWSPLEFVGQDIDIDQRGPLLTTKWNQSSPFNDQVRSGHPAGCVPIALGQVMAHHAFPRALTISGVRCELASMRRVRQVVDGELEDNDPVGSIAVGHFIRHLGCNEYCRVWYNVMGQGQSFATPARAKRTMEKFGYKGVRMNKSYDTDKVIDMISKGNPVFYAAIPSGEPTAGHAWVMDGYMKRTTRRHYRQYRNDQTKHYTLTGSSTLIHCNWGWGGQADGYYVSGFFNPTKGPSSRENDIGDSTVGGNKKGDRYTSHVRFITYTNPNN